MKKISQSLLSAYARILGSLGGRAGSRENKIKAVMAANNARTPEQRTALARKAGLASAVKRKRTK